jgi:hypothetical protein
VNDEEALAAEPESIAVLERESMSRTALKEAAMSKQSALLAEIVPSKLTTSLPDNT